MKWNKGLALGALLSVALPVFAAEQNVEQPQDYGWGSELTVANAAPWYRVELPLNVYQQTAWPDLRDVRVFNHQGEAVPFSLVAQTATQPAPEPINMRLFKLDTVAGPADQQASRKRDTVFLRSKNGTEIRLEGEDPEESGQSYLLMLPENEGQSHTLSQLRLAWEKPAGNWQGKVSVFVSSDLRYWRPLTREVPLMDLAGGDDRLKVDQFDLDLTIPADEKRYLLMVFDTKTPQITLTGVTAISEAPELANRTVSLVAKGEKTSSTEAILQWEQPQPLASLTIELQEEGVLPANISWRTAADGEWQPLTKQVIYRLKGSTSGSLVMPTLPVQGIRISALNAHIPDTLPEVTGQRDSQTLVFNAQGKGPFMLAWGNKSAQSSAVSLDMLIPAELRKNGGLENADVAQAQEKITLGGEVRMKASTPVERQNLLQTSLIWMALILGVAVLVWMALKLWREVQSGKNH